MKWMVFCYATFGACAAMAGGLSSRTVCAYLDNGEMPAARVVGEGGTVSLVLAGEWFGSGACELLVDGVSVASSDGSAITYALAGAESTWRTYRITLKSAEGEIERLVTLYPWAGFACSMHHMSVKNDLLDSSPAGTPRKVPFGKAVPVAWSGLWNEGADRSVVTLYAGHGTGGAKLAVPVEVDEVAEGECAVGPNAPPMPSGDYTLTHFDGVETLTAYLRVNSGRMVFTIR